ncbi:MAG: alkaline phosphatase [Clostridia bacterium]|nr:alkaline phosphatase [Clostridia bacterium]
MANSFYALRGTAFAKVIAVLISALLSLNLAMNSILYSGEEADPGDYKNVILLIGDGMGFNHLYWMEQKYGVDANIFTMAQYVGGSKTQSSSAYVTDSAAGGTALACGTRTTNGALGVFPQDQFGVTYVAMNLCELAQSYGKMTGVVTSDDNSGATPSSFSAHVYDRDEKEEITRQQIEESGIDLIWAHNNGLVTDDWANEYGWTLVNNNAEFAALEEGERSFGAFDGNLWNTDTGADSPNLSTLTEKAIDMLDDDEDGFFLMVEGAHIDKHSHNQDPENMLPSAYEFDQACRIALEYAAEREDTLVVITADHETGAISLEDDGSFQYNSGSHSGVVVPLAIYGSDNFVQDGEHIKNKEVSRRIAMAMGAAPDEFPYAVKQ